ncbi:MAG: response regulator transcription factor [Fimbriimonadaceae bacterium]|nr:response regulator transcription factor [Fimbriimonadaceae bacterium]
MAKILVIDDDRFILKSLKDILTAEKFEVTVAANAVDGYRALTENVPALLILDVNMPDEDGFSLCRKIRSKYTMPILMLSSRNETIDKVIGLEMGADDYLTKPFESRELLARIRAQLRRNKEYTEANENTAMQAGELEMDLDKWQVRVRGEVIPLTSLEFRLVEYMLQNSGRVLSRDQIFERVWGYDEAFNQNSLEVMVYRLRQKLEKPLGKRLIHTVRGYGYRLEVTENVAS